MNRLSPIYTADHAEDAMAEITRLTTAYKDAHKRTSGKALSPSLLSICGWGGSERRFDNWGISLMWEDSQSAAAQWVRENVMEGAVAV